MNDTSTPRTTTSLNDRLQTEHVLGKNDDSSFIGRATKNITGFVGDIFSPRQLLGVLQVLKAVTICFLGFGVLANLMYIVFLEMFANNQVKTIAGGTRDLMVRIYALALSIMAIFIELNHAKAVKAFYGFKGFVPRGILLFFIALITSPDATHYSYIERGDDDAQHDDYVSNNSNHSFNGSAVAFQMTASCILAFCAFIYFLFGILCIDRLTSDAFMTRKDPLLTTAIPTPEAIKATDVPKKKKGWGIRTP